MHSRNRNGGSGRRGCHNTIDVQKLLPKKFYGKGEKIRSR